MPNNSASSPRSGSAGGGASGRRTDTPDQQDGRRARGAATRTAVLKAATDLFAAHGYSATSLAAIAAASGVKTNSIHHAFGSKEGLLAAVIEQVGDTMFNRIDAITHDPIIPPAQRAVAAGHELAAHPEFMRLFLLLTLERQEGDPAILRIVADIRARARAVVAHAVQDRVATVADDQKRQLLDEFGRLTLIMLDGAFLSPQIDGEAAFSQRTFELVTMALDGALSEMVRQSLHAQHESGGPHAG